MSKLTVEHRAKLLAGLANLEASLDGMGLDEWERALIRANAATARVMIPLVALTESRLGQIGAEVGALEKQGKPDADGARRIKELDRELRNLERLNMDTGATLEGMLYPARLLLIMTNVPYPIPDGALLASPFPPKESGPDLSGDRPSGI